MQSLFEVLSSKVQYVKNQMEEGFRESKAILRRDTLESFGK